MYYNIESKSIYVLNVGTFLQFVWKAPMFNVSLYWYGLKLSTAPVYSVFNL